VCIEVITFIVNLCYAYPSKILKVVQKTQVPKLINIRKSARDLTTLVIVFNY